MDDFDRLLALTRAAESCNGLARSFIDHYGDEPQFSRFLSAKGQPYCQPAASMQAKGRLDHAERESEKLEEYIRRWDQACEAHYFVEKAAADQRLPVIDFNGATYATAHAAARYFAEAVRGVISRVEGDGDIEQCFDLARLLADFRPVPDYYGLIRRESTAAEEFIPTTPEDTFEQSSDDEARSRGDLSLQDSGTSPPATNKFYVTLRQMAGYVQRTKKTLERMKAAGELPEPDIKAPTPGSPDEWLWSKVRPILEKKFSRSLPEVFPTLTK